jgi:predicted phage tail protein
MVTILLYGELGRRFGRRFDFYINSPAEAIRALAVQIPGFRQFFLDHADTPFKVIGEIARDASHEYTEDDLTHPQSKGTLKIVPQVTGSSAAGPWRRFNWIGIVDSKRFFIRDFCLWIDYGRWCTGLGRCS